MMRNKIKTQRKSLVISFSGCQKDDRKDDKKDNAPDRIGAKGKGYGTRGDSQHAKQISSQLSYKF